MIKYPAQIVSLSMRQDTDLRSIELGVVERYPIGKPYVVYGIKYFTDPPTTIDLLESSCHGIDMTLKEFYEGGIPIDGFVEIDKRGKIQFIANKRE